MTENVLISGGAGFIGSHLADALLQLGHHVTVLDDLHPQVHGAKQQPPGYLHPEVVFIRADVCDRRMLEAALDDKTVVFHFAALTGVGQSMYQIREYLHVNVQGTATLLELISQKGRQVKKLILASSRAVYGEGAYECAYCGPVSPNPRTIEDLRASQWDVICPNCRRVLKPLPTPESKRTNPRSVYAISKLNQEQLCLLTGESYGFPVVALRFFNVYGPRQSLKNPYTGVISTFINRLANGKAPHVYEDGLESRDFVHVRDAVAACLQAMDKREADGQVINVGSGLPLTLLEIAQSVAREFGGPPPVISGQFRAGDIRHCYADLSRANGILGYEPQVAVDAGIRELIRLLRDRELKDLSQVAARELEQRGLAGGIIASE